MPCNLLCSDHMFCTWFNLDIIQNSNFRFCIQTYNFYYFNIVYYFFFQSYVGRWQLYKTEIKIEYTSVLPPCTVLVFKVVWQVSFCCWITWSISSWQNSYKGVCFLNPNWHELRKQEKCSSLAPPRSKFYKTQWAWQ